MFDRLKYLYDNGKLSAVGLYNAVSKGWMTAAQYNEIVNTSGDNLS